MIERLIINTQIAVLKYQGWRVQNDIESLRRDYLEYDFFYRTETKRLAAYCSDLPLNIVFRSTILKHCSQKMIAIEAVQKRLWPTFQYFNTILVSRSEHIDKSIRGLTIQKTLTTPKNHL